MCHLGTIETLSFLLGGYILASAVAHRQVSPGMPGMVYSHH